MRAALILCGSRHGILTTRGVQCDRRGTRLVAQLRVRFAPVARMLLATSEASVSTTGVRRAGSRARCGQYVVCTQAALAAPARSVTDGTRTSITSIGIDFSKWASQQLSINDGAVFWLVRANMLRAATLTSLLPLPMPCPCRVSAVTTDQVLTSVLSVGSERSRGTRRGRPVDGAARGDMDGRRQRTGQDEFRPCVSTACSHLSQNTLSKQSSVHHHHGIVAVGDSAPPLHGRNWRVEKLVFTNAPPTPAPTVVISAAPTTPAPTSHAAISHLGEPARICFRIVQSIAQYYLGNTKS